jgi:predicted AAA+ superfamily ATPase
MKILKRYFKSPENSYFLFGPRGTGKTTWLKRNCKNELIIDLLDPGIYDDNIQAVTAISFSKDLIIKVI